MLLFLHLFNVYCIVLLLQFLNLTCFLASLFNLFYCFLFLRLQHPNTILQLLYVSLYLKANAASLPICEIVTFYVDYDIFIPPIRTRASIAADCISLHAGVCLMLINH